MSEQLQQHSDLYLSSFDNDNIENQGPNLEAHDAMKLLQSMHASCTSSSQTNQQQVRSWISINEIKKMVGPMQVEPPLIVSTSSKGGNGVDSVLFSSFTAPRDKNFHLRQKSSLNTTRSAKPLVAIDHLMEDKRGHLKTRQNSITNLKNPQFINASQDYLKYLNEADSQKLDLENNSRYVLSQDQNGNFPQEYLQNISDVNSLDLLSSYKKRNLQIQTQIDDNFEITDLQEQLLQDSENQKQPELLKQSIIKDNIAVCVTQVIKKKTPKTAKREYAEQIICKLKTDVQLLKEMVQEEKLKSTRIQTQLQKELLRKEVNENQHFQMQAIRIQLEAQYQNQITTLKMQLSDMAAKLDHQKQSYQRTICEMGSQIKKLAHEKQLLVQNQVHMQQYESVNSLIDTKMHVKIPTQQSVRTKMQTLQDNNDLGGPQQTYLDSNHSSSKIARDGYTIAQKKNTGMPCLTQVSNLQTLSLHLSSDASQEESSISYLTKVQSHNTRKTTNYSQSFIPPEKSSTKKTRFNLPKSQLDSFNMMSHSLSKYQGNPQKAIISEGDSCDVSASVCDDSAIHNEDVGIANKIRCVNVHNNIQSIYKQGPLQSPAKSDSSNHIAEVEIQLEKKGYLGAPVSQGLSMPYKPRQLSNSNSNSNLQSKQQYMHTFGGRYSNCSVPPLDLKQHQTEFLNFEQEDSQQNESSRFSQGTFGQHYQINSLRSSTDAFLMSLQSHQGNPKAEELSESLKRFQFQLANLLSRQK